MKIFSLVLPCYNESENIHGFEDFEEKQNEKQYT